MKSKKQIEELLYSECDSIMHGRICHSGCGKEHLIEHREKIHALLWVLNDREAEEKASNALSVIQYYLDIIFEREHPERAAMAAAVKRRIPCKAYRDMHPEKWKEWTTVI